MTKREHKKLIQLKKVTTIIEKDGYLPSFFCESIYRLGNDTEIGDIKCLEILSKKYLRKKGFYKQDTAEVKEICDHLVYDMRKMNL